MENEVFMLGSHLQYAKQSRSAMRHLDSLCSNEQSDRIRNFFTTVIWLYGYTNGNCRGNLFAASIQTATSSGSL
jgi:hypothetical protein